MKISDIRSSKGPGALRPKKAAKGTGGNFRKALEEAAGAAEADAPVEPSTVAPVDSILAIQEVPDATDGRSRGLMRQYGNDLLDRLDEVRHDLLTGAIPKERLAELAAKVRQQKNRSDDPRLNEIIEEVELRVEVEIAKWTRDRG